MKFAVHIYARGVRHIEADTPDEARAKVRAVYPKCVITKTKAVR